MVCAASLRSSILVGARNLNLNLGGGGRGGFAAPNPKPYLRLIHANLGRLDCPRRNHHLRFGPSSSTAPPPPPPQPRAMIDDAVSPQSDHTVDDDGDYASGAWKSEDGTLSCGFSSIRGRRESMEDFYDIKTAKINGETVSFFGIFDGHGGSRAAEYLKEHLFDNLAKHPQFTTDTKTAISETFKRTDSDFLDAESNNFRDDGSTAVTAVLVGNHLFVANVGDSRAVISQAGKAIPLSDDQKPNRVDERKRIENAGGVVMWAGTWRVGGILAMSRAFGNRLLKQFVVAEPEIQEHDIDDESELLVLASDGLWDVVPNEDVVLVARTEEDPEAAAQKLKDIAFSRGSWDNITCMVVRFNNNRMDMDSPLTSEQS